MLMIDTNSTFLFYPIIINERHIRTEKAKRSALMVLAVEAVTARVLQLNTSK